MAADLSAEPVSREEMEAVAQKLQGWANQLSPREQTMLMRVFAHAAGAGASPKGGPVGDIVEPVQPPVDNFVLELALALYEALQAVVDAL